jgi:hypothetical protein
MRNGLGNTTITRLVSRRIALFFALHVAHRTATLANELEERLLLLGGKTFLGSQEMVDHQFLHLTLAGRDFVLLRPNNFGPRVERTDKLDQLFSVSIHLPAQLAARASKYGHLRLVLLPLDVTHSNRLT